LFTNQHLLIRKDSKKISEWLTQAMNKPLGMGLKTHPKSLVNELITMNDDYYSFPKKWYVNFQTILIDCLENQ
jgi:hypothetical protein